MKPFQNMSFDVNKATEVEGMSAIDFGVWKSAKQNEVIILIDDNFRTQFPIKLIADKRLQFWRNLAAGKDPDSSGC